MVEILLRDRAFCCLTELVLTSFLVFNKDGSFSHVDLDNLKRVLKLQVRANLRQTNIDVGLDGWREHQWEDRLLGVGYTGEQDTLDTAGEGFRKQWPSILRELRGLVHVWADELADEMSIPHPILYTTNKPAGCLTLNSIVTTTKGVFTLGEMLEISEHQEDELWSDLNGEYCSYV